MSQPSTLVVTATPNPEAMDSAQAYLQGSMPLLLAAGGKLVKRLNVTEVIHGNPRAMVLVMDFESDQVIKDLYESDEYTALIPDRVNGFAEMNILVTHEM